MTETTHTPTRTLCHGCGLIVETEHKCLPERLAELDAAIELPRSYHRAGFLKKYGG